MDGRNVTGKGIDARSVDESAEDTRRRLMAAAVRCVLRWGVAKTGLNDIASEARCSRQTVYNHFPNAEAVIQAALLDASYAFSDRMVATIEALDTPGERIVEAMMFCLEQLPNEPFLQLVGDPALGRLVSESLFTSETSRAVIDRVAVVCLEGAPELESRANELGEMMTRLVLSFLVLQGQELRTGDEMRAYLRRWLLPGVGLASGAASPPMSSRADAKSAKAGRAGPKPRSRAGSKVRAPSPVRRDAR